MEWFLIFLNIFVGIYNEDEIFGFHPNGIKQAYITEDIWIKNNDTIWVVKFNYIDENKDTMNLRADFKSTTGDEIPKQLKKYYKIKKWKLLYKNDYYIKAYHPIFLERKKN